MERPFMSEEALRVLVVDDEESFAKVTAMHLKEHYGYETTVVFSGTEAVAMLGDSQHEFDLILLDYMMPEMNGLNVLQWMHEQKNGTPVIMVTGAGAEHVAVEAMKLGAYDYVQKDHIDIGHLDILMRGTHERYLFQKEKEQYIQLLRDRDRVITSLESFHGSIDSLSHIVNNSLALVALNIREYSSALAPEVKEETQKKVHRVFEEIEREYSFIASVVALILRFSSAMQAMLTDEMGPSQQHTALKTEIESLVQAHKENMDS
jgi:DNA-binding response OmpR family regulator